MNFLTSAFSTLTGSSLPYTLKEKIVDATLDRNSVWSIISATNPKADNAPVTVFEFDIKQALAQRNGYEVLARNAFKKLKLVKLPGIISIVDYIENDSYLYIITEPVVPLLHYLRDPSSGDAINSENSKLFGIYSIAHALQFVNMTCKCLHGNFNINDSVYVTRLGDWKLFGFELLTNLTSDPDQPVYRASHSAPYFKNTLPPEVVSNSIESIRSFPIKLDSFRFAIFISQILSTRNFSDFISKPLLQPTFQSVPGALVNALKKLANPKPTLRSTIEKFNKDTASFFEACPLIIFDKALEEVKFKSDEERLHFFKYELAQFIGDRERDMCPPGFLNHKVLPELIQQYRNTQRLKLLTPASVEETQNRQETLLVLLGYIIKFGVALDQAHFTKLVTPIILDAFQMNDRQVRLILLTHLRSFLHFLTELEVQLKIFYPLVSGFHDTNFTIRENTLTSITVIIDKVSVKQVNQDLLKLLAKSQMDPKPSIRVNTLILVIKISGKIYKLLRNNVLITALAKSLRDTFIPCKMKAIEGFENLIDGFSLEEICSKVLGHLAITLMDPKSAKVRNSAKRVFQLYLNSVEEHAKGLPDMDDAEEKEEQEFFQQLALREPVSTPLETSENSVSKLATGWNLVNKLVSLQVNGTMNKDLNASTPSITRTGTPTNEPLKTIKDAGPKVLIQQQHRHPLPQWGDEDDDALLYDGWNSDTSHPLDDEDGFVATPKPVVAPAAATKRPPAAKKLLSSTKRSGGLQVKKTTSTKPKISQLKLDIEDDPTTADGWGFDEDW